jgi:hypothetical protein
LVVLNCIQIPVKKQEPTAELLRGWKAIAGFLSQPASTVHRWAKEGMPVRREGPNVVADPKELNAWLGRESHAPAAVTITSQDLIADLRRGLSAVKKKRAA